MKKAFHACPASWPVGNRSISRNKRATRHHVAGCALITVPYSTASTRLALTAHRLTCTLHRRGALFVLRSIGENVFRDKSARSGTGTCTVLYFWPTLPWPGLQGPTFHPRMEPCSGPSEEQPPNDARCEVTMMSQRGINRGPKGKVQ